MSIVSRILYFFVIKLVLIAIHWEVLCEFRDAICNNILLIVLLPKIAFVI